MMRRILCLALAMVLLCGTAMADAVKYTMTWDADVEGAKSFWAEASGAEGSVLDSMAKAMVELMEGLKIQWITQDDGMYMAISLKDTVVLDLGVQSDWDYSRIFSNLWADHYLSTTISQEEADRSRQSWEQLSAINLDQMAADAVSELKKWLDGLEATEEVGDFSGDTYEGATLLCNYAFDDQSVVQLVESLLVVMQRSGLTDELLEGYLGEEANVYESIRQKNLKIAGDNRFSYVLQVACGPENEYMGATLLVMENGEQVMTLSHGLVQDGWQLVWGYGLNGVNYYLNLDCMAQAETGEKQVGLFFFQDPQGLGFKQVELSGEYLLLMATGAFYPQQSGEWTTLAEILLLDQEIDCYVVEGIRNEADRTAEYAVHWFSGETMDVPLQTIHINVEPCEPQTWDLDSLTPIDADVDGSDELLTQVVEKNTQELLLNLFKLVPTQLLTMLIM